MNIIQQKCFKYNNTHLKPQMTSTVMLIYDHVSEWLKICRKLSTLSLQWQQWKTYKLLHYLLALRSSKQPSTDLSLSPLW